EPPRASSARGAATRRGGHQRLPLGDVAADPDLLRRCGGQLVAEPAQHALDEAADAVGRRDALFGQVGLDGAGSLRLAEHGAPRGEDAAAVATVHEGGDDGDDAFRAADAVGREEPELVDGGDRDVLGDDAEQCLDGSLVGPRGGVGGLGHARASSAASGGCGASVPAVARSAASASSCSMKWRSTWRKSWALVMTPNAWWVPRSLSLLMTNSEESTATVVRGRIDSSASTT